MAVSFNLMPADIRVPGVYVEIDSSRAYAGLSGYPTRILVIGQRLAGGSAAALPLQQITRAEQADTLFGRGPQLARMIWALKAVNSYSDCWAIGVGDLNAGVAATGSVTFGGTVTGAGTLSLMIAGRRLQVAVASGDATSAIATAVAAAINADLDGAVTAAVNGGNTSKVDLTARHKGEAGNALDVRTNYWTGEVLPAGLTVTVTAMSGGTGNPGIATVIARLGDEWFTDIVMPWTDAANLAALEAELADRFGPLRMIEGHAYAGAAGSHASLVTLGHSRNSPHITLIGACKSPTPPWEWAAAWGGVCAYHLTIDPARPVQTLELAGVLPPAAADRFTQSERNILLYNGIATWRVTAGGTVAIERSITTYRETPAGYSDPSYLDIETVRTVAYLRYDVRTFIGLRYPRFKLADDGTAAGRGQAVVTPKVIRADLVARFRQWEEAALVEDIEQFKADLIVERDSNDPNRVNALIPPNVVNQLRVFVGLIQFRL